MPNLPETVQWESGIFQLELTTPASGGANGLANLQAKQLGNRTAYLHTTGHDQLAVYADTTALAAGLPPAASLRGKFALVNSGGAGEPDRLYVCVKTGAGSYDWLPLPFQG